MYFGYRYFLSCSLALKYSIYFEPSLLWTEITWVLQIFLRSYIQQPDTSALESSLPIKEFHCNLGGIRQTVLSPTFQDTIVNGTTEGYTRFIPIMY